MGERFSQVTAELFAANAYRDYLELHGLSVQLAEALAELWHHRIRTELGIAGEDGEMTAMLQKAGLSRGTLQLRLWRLPRPGPTLPDRGPAAARPHRRAPERGVPAASRTVHRRHRRHPSEAKYFNT